MPVQKPALLDWVLSLASWHIRIPPWTQDIFGVRIFSEGQWISTTIGVGYWISWAIDQMLGPINAAIALVQAVTNVFQTVYETINNVYNTVHEYITNTYQTIYETVQNVYNTVHEHITNTYQTIYETVQNVYNTVHEHITNVYQTVQGVTAAFVSTAINAALAPLAPVINTVSAFREEIEALFSDPEEWLLGKIESMLDRFW